MRLLSTIKAAFEEGVYLLDGVLSHDDRCMSFSASNQLIKTYDVRSGAHVCDMVGHSEPITDLVTCRSNTSILYSCQQNTGVMISDLRVGKAVHFLTELTTSGMESYSLSVDPSGNRLALAVNGDIQLIDTRTWTSCGNPIMDIHSDEITRIRFCNDNWLCTAGEDHLINVLDLAAKEDDMMLDVINAGEVVHKMHWHPEQNVVTATGSCENAWIINLTPGSRETKICRRDFDTYCVDFATLDNKSTLAMVLGRSSEESHCALDVVSCTPGSEGQVRGSLTNGHKEIARVCLSLGDRLITAGEDSSICVWSTASEEPMPVADEASQKAARGTATLQNMRGARKPY